MIAIESDEHCVSRWQDLSVNFVPPSGFKNEMVKDEHHKSNAANGSANPHGNSSSLLCSKG